MNLLHNDLESLLTPGTIVAHYKRANYLNSHKDDKDFDKNMYIYQVCGIATDVDKNWHYVVYQAMYGRREVFVRQINNFLDTVEERVGTELVRTPRFAIYTEPVDIVNPQIPTPKKHNEAKKLHKKIKNLAAEVKKLREENDQLKKEVANTHALKKSVKNPSVSVVTDASGVVGEQSQHLKEDGTYESTTGPYPRTIPTLADAPVEPHTVKAEEIRAKEFADALCGTVCDALYDAASKDIPKELLK